MLKLVRSSLPKSGAPIRSYSNLSHPACPIEAQSKTDITTNASKCSFTEEEYQNARPFLEIPGPSAIKLISNLIFPWGRYYGNDTMVLFKELQKEYGNLVRFPAMFGNDAKYFVFDPRDMEVMFRNEGPTPFRKALETFGRFRLKERPDLFGETAGLVQE